MLSPRTLILNLPFSRPWKMSCQTREKIIQLFFWVYLARCFRFNVTELISPHVFHLRFSTKPERPVARKHSIVLKVDQPNVTQWHVNPITSSTVLWFDKRSSCYICLSNLKVFCMYVGLLWELWGLYTWRGRGGPSMWRPFEALMFHNTHSQIWCWTLSTLSETGLKILSKWIVKYCKKCGALWSFALMFHNTHSQIWCCHNTHNTHSPTDWMDNILSQFHSQLISNFEFDLFFLSPKL